MRKSAEWLTVVLKRDHHAVWVADFGDGKLVGYLWVHLRRYRDARIPPVWGYIAQAFLEEAWRGQGLMRPMLDGAFQWFREKGMTHVTLGVIHHNWIGSSAWYKFGFEDYNHERLLILKNKPTSASIALLASVELKSRLTSIAVRLNRPIRSAIGHITSMPLYSIEEHLPDGYIRLVRSTIICEYSVRET